MCVCVRAGLAWTVCVLLCNGVLEHSDFGDSRGLFLQPGSHRAGKTWGKHRSMFHWCESRRRRRVSWNVAKRRFPLAAHS